jgi:hypothetical protein
LCPSVAVYPYCFFPLVSFAKNVGTFYLYSRYALPYLKNINPSRPQTQMIKKNKKFKVIPISPQSSPVQLP